MFENYIIFISAATRRKFHRWKSNVMAAACETTQNSLQRVYKSPLRPGQQRNTPPIYLLLGHGDAGITPAQLFPHRLPAVELLPGQPARPHLSPPALAAPAGAPARPRPDTATPLPPPPPLRGPRRPAPTRTAPPGARRGERGRDCGARAYLHLRRALAEGGSLCPLLVLLLRGAVVPGSRQPQRHARCRPGGATRSPELG